MSDMRATHIACMRFVNLGLALLRGFTAQQSLLLELHPDSLAETRVPTKFGGNDHPRYAQRVLRGGVALSNELLCVSVWG